MNRRLCIALAGFCLPACVEDGSPERSGSFDLAFVEESRIAFDTIPAATLGQISDVLVLDDQILVTDQMSDRVVGFSRDGTFRGAIGRNGDGPGEFRNPVSLLRANDGTVLVSDVSPRVTRIAESLELLDVFTVREWDRVGALSRVGQDVVLFQPSSRSEGENFHRWSTEEGLGEAFDRRSELVLTVPYWNATWTTHLAATSDRVFVADNMVYPLRLYSLGGELQDTVGAAPPSWRQARRPQVGEFASPEGQRTTTTEWFGSFDVIDGLFTVNDRWLIVTHRRRVSEYRTDDEIRADVYSLEAGVTKVWEDVRMPGPVLRGGTCAWTLAASPPDPWTLACLVPRSPE